MGQLDIENLVFRHVGPLSLSVGKGECVGLVGPSGVGKTLFIRAVADLDPHEGRVMLDGTDSGSMSGPDWRRKVGLLPAESRWWFETVGEHFRALSPEALKRLGFGEEAALRKVRHLSSGERQRLALLRLLAVEPAVLLLDEPTANLDPDNTRRVEEMVRDYLSSRNAAAVWVSHDVMQLKRMAARCLYLSDGRLEQVEDLDAYADYFTDAR